MKNETNIYDIDGEIIRAAGDNHKITIDEAQQMMEKYRQKLQEIGENDKKAVIYATYMRNLSNYILTQYSTMTPEEFTSALTAKINEKSDEDSVKKAIDDLKEEVEDKPIVMDEYVDFEEVPA